MSLPRFEPCIPLPLENHILEEIIPKAKDWALMHGAAMRSKTNFSADVLQFAPFVLLPSVFPRKEFNKAVSIQVILNELVHKVANDHDFLHECLKSIITVDEFTGQLFNIYKTVHCEGVSQPLSLGLVRSDVMLETSCRAGAGAGAGTGAGTGASGCRSGSGDAPFEPYCCWKQVEVNTIASGFGWLGPASALLHSYILKELGKEELQKNLPENNALEGLCGGMLEAWKLYNKEEAVILFVVEDVTYNICDQRFHEFKIREMAPDVRVIRKSLTQLAREAQLRPSKELVICGWEVAVVYFRSGYEPAQYHSPREWEARLLVERSRAIKCPSINYHLAGTKKVQQALARKGALERFIDDPTKVETLRGIFTGLYAMDFDENGEEAVSLALSCPERFVLKPQREGGGNNVYGPQVKTAVENMKTSVERTAWILMERIKPPVLKSYMIRPGASETHEIEPIDVVCELGIFGVVIGDGEKIVSNRQVGHMLRTKKSSANEGGVAAGDGALDSPFLVD